MSAREGIIERRVCVEQRKERIRFADWNRVATVVGGGLELRSQHINSDGSAMEMDDCIARIDGLDFDWDGRDPYHRDSISGQPLIGGFAVQGRTLSFSDDAVTT